MPQAVENLTQLVGTIVARQPHPQLGDYDIVTLDVERAEPVEGKANLLATAAGNRLEVATRRALLGAATAGAKVQLRAKRTLDGAMSEPHPEAGHFRIE
jgi:hypothetical protein